MGNEIGSVTVCYLGLMRGVTGLSKHQVSFDQGETLGQMLERLCGKHGAEFRGRIWDRNGQFQVPFKLLLNSNEAHERLEQPLRSGDRLDLVYLSPVAGGQS